MAEKLNDAGARRAAFLLLMLAGCAGTTAASSQATRGAPSYEWPVPDGWKSERIPFPLDFAPSLPYRGVEELRFAPQFFKPASETYFTYTFAFVLEGAPEITTEQLGADLTTYYTGLASAVKKRPPEPKLHAATITPSTPGQFFGKVRTIDAFGDSRAIELNVIGETFVCDSRRIVLTSLSPHTPGDAVWGKLAEVRGAFKIRGCRG